MVIGAYFEWQEPDKMNDTSAEKHVVGIYGYMADDLADRKDASCEVPE